MHIFDPPKLLTLFLSIATSLFSFEEDFLLINGRTDEVIASFGSHLYDEISPCSTFKIPLSLMGYDAKVLEDEDNPVWDFQEGYENWLPSWQAPHSPLSWMKESCVWYSKLLYLELGLSTVENYITLFGYGNQAEPSDLFWINSSLKISPKEQVLFLQKMVQGELPVSKRALAMTKKLLFKEELSNGWQIFGKTGWSGSAITDNGKTLEHAWFVGWIEKEDTFYPFAYLIRGDKIDLNKRIPRTKELFAQSTITKRL
ncbi:MAG: class D beta-lactamase [Verrucomicrobia bacterium]|nr:class D beta-lactamase [Verrucomicrobiota bacterium]